jgi:hypothetical protein
MRRGITVRKRKGAGGALYYGKVLPAREQIDDLVKIDLNESEEACFKWQGECIGL